MDITLKICPEKKQNVISDLCQFYYYDLNTHSTYAKLHYHEGRYEQMAYFENYWLEKDRFPYLIYHQDIPIGFALVNTITVNPKANLKLAEFFVMAPYQKKGVGKATVKALFEQHHGLWEISVLKDNAPAMRFWKKVLANPHPFIHNEYPNYLYFEHTS